MAVTKQTRSDEQWLGADEYAPLRRPRRGPPRARAPGRRRRPDPARRPEAVPMWMGLAVTKSTAATEAAFRGR
jgi:hypothetical protein